MSDPKDIATAWLSKFAAAVSLGKVQATVSTILPHGWFRDVLVFSWNTRSLNGQDKIASYLRNTLPSAGVARIKLDERPGLKPESIPDYGVAAGFTFETSIALGRGRAYLTPDSSGEWKALSVFMMMEDLKGHLEVGPEAGVYGGHTLSWEEVNGGRRAQIENDPYVVIIGAGQTGLHVAARFKQMDIPSIVVERHSRVGDQWRKRYPTLSLHTTRKHHTLLYQPYPQNWPTYTPRDKVANWLEQYAESQDLIVWTNSYLLPGATYNRDTKKWDVIVNRNGTQITIHPAHVVIAIGTLGAPRIPDLEGQDVFKGVTLHASQYMGGLPYVGKRAIVIGAGNTSADICQDLSFRGAQSVTMVQRSSTCVVSSKTIAQQMSVAFPDNAVIEVCDFKFHSLPLGLQRKMAMKQEEQMWEREKDLHNQLRKGGMKLNMGRDGSGQHFLVFERSGGFWIDVGCGELIGSGKVKIKQGAEPTRFTDNTLVFSDGSELEADVVVYATGYLDPRQDIKGIFGSEVVEQTSDLWGLDEESEIKGSYRPSGYPGLWYSGGDFAMSRSLSKQLALQIKAIELGLMRD